jgi:predicted flap endonuclease-1-like 5' DNA nuclease
MARIDEVEGIGPAYAEKLAAASVKTTDELLAAGASAGGRDKLAQATGITGKLILEWVNHCDLMRLKGVGSEYSDLLEAAGVDSPAELAQRNAANLVAKIAEVVAAKPSIVRRAPTQSMIEGWIAEAKTLDKVVTH